MSFFFSAGIRGGVIPDSDLLHSHYDANQLDASDGDTLSEWDDVKGNNNLDSGGGEYKDSAINGHPAVYFDGSDGLATDSWDAGLNQDFAIYAVFQISADTIDGEAIFSGYLESDTISHFRADSENYVIFSGNGVEGGDPDTDVHVVSAVFDNSDSSFNIDGSEITSGDAGNYDINAGMDFGIGFRPSEDDFRLKGYVGEVLVYQETPSTSDVEKYLSDKWDHTIA